MSDVTVGCRAIEVTDTVQAARVPTWLLFPAHGEAHEERFGTYALDVAMGAAAVGEQLPLVVISHGTGSTPWVLRDLASYLVREGFVVALLAHPGNTRMNDTLANTTQNLVNRPRHIQVVIDAAFADAEIGPRLSTNGVGVVGHSLGGYTALAVGGGHPVTLPHESPDGKTHPFDVVHDPRVRAIVLLAPAAPWLMPTGALADVTIPVLMRTGEKDQHSPVFYDSVLLPNFPDRSRVDYQMVPNAGHFSFLSPFPPAMTGPLFPPSQDPPGFDRPAYLPVLCGEVLAFLRAAL